MRAASTTWLRGLAHRGLLLLPTALVLLVVLATPAVAHGRGSDATNYDSRLTAAPEIPGASWAIHGGDELLELDSPEREVLILGYSDEPYLRIGPDGVFENQNAPATYLNEDRYRVDLPAGVSADPDAEPAWERVSSGTSFAWHDHRIHMMTTALPRQIAQEPDTEQLVLEWQVPAVVDGTRMAVAGELHWVPGPSPWPWLLLGAIVAVPALAAVRAQDPNRLIRPAALVLGAVSALNLSRIVDDLLAMPLPATTIGLAVLQTALFLLIGLLGAAKAWRGGDGAATALGVGSAAILVGQGLLYVSVLTASQLTSVFPDAFGRFLVGASIAQALTVGPIAFIANRRVLAHVEADKAEAPAPA